jgi:hypothetical protein
MLRRTTIAAGLVVFGDQTILTGPLGLRLAQRGVPALHLPPAGGREVVGDVCAAVTVESEEAE